MDVYEVICYVNKEIENKAFYTNLNTAITFANYCEDKGYICEVHKYTYHSTIRRDFWRDAKTDDSCDDSCVISV